MLMVTSCHLKLSKQVFTVSKVFKQLQQQNNNPNNNSTRLFSDDSTQRAGWVKCPKCDIEVSERTSPKTHKS